MGFGDRLRELRKQRHYTQDDLSRLTGFAKSTISMYESGQRKPSYEVLEAFADYFNVDMNTLTGKDGENTSAGNATQTIGRDILKALSKGYPKAQALVEKMRVTEDGDVVITGVDAGSAKVIGHAFRGAVAALDEAELTGDSSMEIVIS